MGWDEMLVTDAEIGDLPGYLINVLHVGVATDPEGTPPKEAGVYGTVPMRRKEAR